MGAADRLADVAVARQIDLLRFDAGVRSRALALLGDLEREIVSRLAGGQELTTYARERLNAQLADIRAAVDSYYARISSATAAELQGLAQGEAEWQTAAINRTVGVDIASAMPAAATLARLADDTMVQGAVMRDWWARQSLDTAFRFSTAIRMGVGTGEANGKIVARVRRELDVSRQHAEALTRTAVQQVASSARQDTLRANADIVEGQQQVSTLDSRTTDICMAYSGGVWSLDGEPIRGTKLPFNGGPPRHWQCRSTLIPVLRSFRELGADFEDMPARSRASLDGQVAGDLSFADWLKSKPAAVADDMLGKGRADLWRQGKITLQQLLDQSGRPLTLEQLRDRHA